MFSMPKGSKYTAIFLYTAVFLSVNNETQCVNYVCHQDLLHALHLLL